MDLNEVSIFIKVVQAGSFSKAAQGLGMPNSTVSAKVSSLEKRLGVTLIQRTTRRLAVTEEGRAYFERCVAGLNQINAADEEIGGSQGLPHGLLRLTAPTELGGTVLPAALAEFRKKHPQVQLEISLTDRSVDLVAEGIDLAIRAGELKDSSLKAKKLGEVYFAPFASPQYLKTLKTLKHPKDLSETTCLQFAPLGIDSWKLTSGKAVAVIPLKKQFVINDLNVLKTLTLSGMGIALLPTFLCYTETQNGRLVRLLPEWKSELKPVHFLYSGQKFTSAKVSAFIELASDRIKKSLENCEL